MVIACSACHDDTWLQYEWDDRQILCSANIDDITQDPRTDDIRDALRIAADHDSVAILHAHTPGATISIAALEDFFDRVDEAGLEYVTYSDFSAGHAHTGAVALSFDDNAIRAWYDTRELLAARGARVTFFVTRYARWKAEDRALLVELAAAGHDVQAHSVDHLAAPPYVEANGLGAYMDDEAVPSISILEDAGYPINAYAFPFGSTSDELNAELLRHVTYVRVGTGTCPY
jgi:peptidoglycan/xylan/chitin deacetylase (PgdA/CDA1 family)